VSKRLGNRVSAAWLFALIIAIGLTGCRPSQQASRNAKQGAKGAQGATAQQMDSLLMVQDKLVTVIDTMTSVLAQDRRRIRDLELEVSRLRSQMEQKRQPAPPMAPPPAYVPAPPVTAPPEGNTNSPAPASPSAPTTSLQSPEEQKYTNALKLFNSSRYEEALASFDELAHNAPTGSNYLPNYIYWRGESLYALGNYSMAIQSFHDVLDKYPSSSKGDDAEFKIGASYEKLGDRTNARMAYQRLLLSYPDSEYAARAKTRLKKLE
jgi:tol-pal system protein YbgF